MKSIRLILFSALALYLIALCVIWTLTTNYAFNETALTLKNAVREFNILVEDEASTMIAFGTRLTAIKLNDIPEPTVEDMRFLAKEYLLDEINLVNADGIIVASNLPELIGVDMNKSEVSRDFMKVFTDENSKLMHQHFRQSVDDPTVVRKYHARQLKGKPFLIEAGVDYRRYCNYLSDFPEQNLLGWSIGTNGHYLPWNSDDFPPTEKIVFKKSLPEVGDAYCLVFSVGEQKFVAMLPEMEYFRQRDLIFYMTAAALFFMLMFLAYFLTRSRMDEERQAREHAEDKKRRAQELETARRIQLSQLPNGTRCFPQFIEFKLTARMDPAREIGGDFYDYYRLDKNHIAFLVADVSGKGIPAALFMMRAKEILKQTLLEHSIPADAMTTANKMLCADNDAGMFVTVFLAICNLDNGKVTYVNAGHNPPCLRHGDGTVEVLAPQGQLLMGMFPEARYTSGTLQLKPGDLLFLYTDGITEAMTPQKKLYGLDRLRNKLSECEVQDTVAIIRKDVEAFAAGAIQSDDITELAFEWHGMPKMHTRFFAVSPKVLTEAMDFIKSHTNDTRMLNAADELLANIVNYSKASELEVAIAMTRDKCLVRFSDNGLPWNPLEHDDSNVIVQTEEKPIGGLGILMVKKLVQNISYEHEGDRNVCTLIMERQAID